MSTKDNAKERFDVHLRLTAEQHEKLLIAMKEDCDDNKAGWVKRILLKEFERRRSNLEKQ